MPESIDVGLLPPYISEQEAIFSLGASRNAFTKFADRHGLRSVTIAGGRLFARTEFLAAVRLDMEASTRRDTKPAEAERGAA